MNNPATATKRSHPAEFISWMGIKYRCYNPNSKSYKDYGGRGISVCAQWLGEGGFKNFLTHVGNRPSATHSIDRINNSGNYEPGNVRWATRSQQNSNRRPCPKRVGFKHSEATKRRISESLKGNKNTKGYKFSEERKRVVYAIPRNQKFAGLM